MSIVTQNKIVPVWRNKTSIKILQSKKIILKLHVLGDAKKRTKFWNSAILPFLTKSS